MKLKNEIRWQKGIGQVHFAVTKVKIILTLSLMLFVAPLALWVLVDLKTNSLKHIKIKFSKIFSINSVFPPPSVKINHLLAIELTSMQCNVDQFCSISTRCNSF